MTNPYTYAFTVTGLKVRDQVNADGETLPNAVVQTYWKITASDSDGDTDEYSGATPFTAENVPAGSFTAFEDLTEANVISWIQARIDGDPTYAQHIKEHFDKRFDEVKGNLRDATMPWAPDVTPDPDALAAEAEAEADPSDDTYSANT